MKTIETTARVGLSRGEGTCLAEPGVYVLPPHRLVIVWLIAVACGWSPLAWGQASLVVNNMVFVAATGTPAENCQNVIDARDAIGDESASNPYLLKLEPGIYDCGFNVLAMLPFISIEGSGAATEIRGAPGAVFGVVDVGSNSELRSVRVVNYGDEAATIGWPAVSAFLQPPVTNARLFDVLAESLGSSGIGLLVTTDSHVRVDHSHLVGKQAAVSLQVRNAIMTASFSLLEGGITLNPGVGGTVAAVCRMCSNATNPLGSDCNP